LLHDPVEAVVHFHDEPLEKSRVPAIRRGTGGGSGPATQPGQKKI